ncbi:MAG: glycosyltransferase family 4 protein [Planctomycetes bacterium]|nr:glycosyltransferase family 4 protein [Planctomycetota bacterium]
MTPRTLLFFHASAELYGSDRTLLQLAEGLDRARWRAVVALPREGPLADHLRAAGATVEVGPLCTFGRATLRPRGLLRAARELPEALRFARALVRRHAPVLVHTNTIVVLSGALAARAERVPHVWHVHEILERPPWLARAVARFVARNAARVACNSAATAEHLRARARFRPGALVVIPNGVARNPAAEEDRARALATLGLDPERRWVLLAGRVNAWKGHALLLQAVQRLVDRHPRLGLVFAGGAPPGQGHFEAALERGIADAGLAERVRRFPFTDDVATLYAAAEVVAVPSTLPEPFGLVAAEAMAAGRAVVAAGHGGLLEIVEEGVTGRLFRPGDAEDLARALDALLSEPGAADAMGRAGRARQREHFSVERYVRDFDALYADVVRATRVREEAAA